MKSHPSNTFLVLRFQRRTLFGGLFGKKKYDQPKAAINPLTEEYLLRKPNHVGSAAPARGALSDSSIFEDEALAGPKPKGGLGPDTLGAQPKVRNPLSMAAALDPRPSTRRRWQRKMVIREIHKRGRWTRTQLLKKQERELVSRSHDFKTSVKKLVPLAKQIAGKTIDQAIAQMRFSKKKAAQDVKEHLEFARNEAIVKRGMGLGLSGKEFTPVRIETKDGKRVKVVDPTTIYVSQAWCGKGLYGKTQDHRARGQINIMKNRTTSKYYNRYRHYPITNELQVCPWY